ncbi:MAG: hypothetical protein OEN56_15375 [Gemmatimonadota bacterium]|nr:hypothetical protein [Gemmatimonadota bacterium]
MSHADPWNEASRLEHLLDAELRAEIERAGVRAAARSFCEGKCRHDDGSCPLGHAIHTQAACPLWMYVQDVTSEIVPDDH